MKYFVTLIILLTASISFSQQLVYTPINPAFGGDTFNYTWLLNSANSQNSFKDPDQNKNELTDLQRFNQSLSDQLLRGISSQLLQNQYGDNILQPGTSTFGNLQLEIFESNQGLIINVLDTTTGDQTQIIVPN